MKFEITFPTIWANFDANSHMRHTAYNDYAAEVRSRFFSEQGFSLTEFSKHNIGPILFSENTKFYREIKLGEDITVNLIFIGASEKFERFKFKHQIIKANGVVSAEISVYGAWIDLAKRKLTTPPEDMIGIFNKLEKVIDFENIILNNK
jgi:acyl-CoA thioester hydrolase|tara:strand:+ start:119560 stop:120006 length:447 start_codon:yes stop_codon:yes gene_type:complete